MTYNFISIINNISIKDSCAELNIFLGSEVIDLCHFPLSEAIGEYWTSDLVKKFCVFFPYFDPGNPEEITAVHNASVSTLFGLGLWLIKDCSVFNQFGYSINNRGGTFSNVLNSFYSDSTGLYTTKFFSNEELSNANKYYDQLSNVIKIDTEINKTPIRSEGQFVSSKRNTNYNLYSKIYRSVNFITKARLTSDLLAKISWYIVALEALFSNETTDISFKLRYRVPIFLGGAPDKKENIYKIINKAYSLRSIFLHGSSIPKEKKALLDISAQIELSTGLDSMLREILTTLIIDEGKRNIILKQNLFNEFFHSNFIGNT